MVGRVGVVGEGGGVAECAADAVGDEEDEFVDLGQLSEAGYFLLADGGLAEQRPEAHLQLEQQFLRPQPLSALTQHSHLRLLDNLQRLELGLLVILGRTCANQLLSGQVSTCGLLLAWGRYSASLRVGLRVAAKVGRDSSRKVEEESCLREVS